MAGPEALPVSLPPAEAIEFFERKGRRIGFAWQDVLHEQHAADFTVAKMMEVDLLDEVHRAVNAALGEGQTFRQFADGLTPLLQSRGWWGRRQMTDPLTGETREVQLGSPRRLRTIFDVNLRTAYAAGQWQRIQRVAPARPWLRYVAVLDARTRPLHRAWHGTILSVDDPWWHTHFPPNGWRCRCTVQQLSDRDLARYGLVPSPAAPPSPTLPWRNPRTGEVIEVPRGIDPGWAYNVGIAGQGAAVARALLDRTVAAAPDIAAGTVAPVMAAIARQLGPDFAAWVDAADPTRPRGERRVIGVLTPAVLRALAAQGLPPPATAAVTVTDDVIGHMVRDAKATAGKALPLALLRRLPAALASPRAVLWDLKDPALVYVFDPPAAADPRLAKLVVRVDKTDRARDADGVRRAISTNAVRSGGLVDISNLSDPNHYWVIEGAL